MTEVAGFLDRLWHHFVKKHRVVARQVTFDCQTCGVRWVRIR